MPDPPAQRGPAAQTKGERMQRITLSDEPDRSPVPKPLRIQQPRDAFGFPRSSNKKMRDWTCRRSRHRPRSKSANIGVIGFKSALGLAVTRLSGFRRQGCDAIRPVDALLRSTGAWACQREFRRRSVISRIRGFRMIRDHLCLDACNRYVRSLTPNASSERQWVS